MKQKIYISGQITEDPNYIEKFNNAQKHLESLDYHVINPVQLVPYDELKKWIDYMLTDLQLLALCDEIYMLDNWERSNGAKIELDIAKVMGLKIIFE